MNKSVIYIRWILTDRIQIFTTLSKVYQKYDSANLGVSIWTLHRKDLYKGYTNSTVDIRRIDINEG